MYRFKLCTRENQLRSWIRKILGPYTVIRIVQFPRTTLRRANVFSLTNKFTMVHRDHWKYLIHWIDRPTDRLTDRPIDRPTDRPIEQSTNWPTLYHKRACFYAITDFSLLYLYLKSVLIIRSKRATILHAIYSNKFTIRNYIFTWNLTRIKIYRFGILSLINLSSAEHISIIYISIRYWHGALLTKQGKLGERRF